MGRARHGAALRLGALAVAGALALTACAGEDDPQAEAPPAGDPMEAPAPSEQSGQADVRVIMLAQSGSGQAGMATLSAVGDDQTMVVVELASPPAEPQPAHIHPGDCADLDPVPAHALTSLEGGRSETVIDVGLGELLARQHAVNAHRSEAEAEVYVSCGPLPLG